ncbi:formiminoglutamase [Acrasis kona]|uniref:Formiminoglutamase n=1 Tax=Acrasis kona TaxID=1008807 RepID=A0AAW2ZG88_9EUKA
MSDVRVGELIQNKENASRGDHIAIIGFPHDEGVRRNGGRVGAARGPENFRKLLKRTGTVINPEFNLDCTNTKIIDLGDVAEDLDFDSSHSTLRQKVSQAISVGSIPFVIGGGNDESYSNAAGLIENVKDISRVAVINIDAHLDVREQKDGLEHSGSPFRLLLETKGFKGSNFIEFAAQGSQCSVQHAEFITKQHNGQIFWLNNLRSNTNGIDKQFETLLNSLDVDHIFFSFDLDSVQSSDAPGVSCPSPIGLTAYEALRLCFIAGSNPKVSLMDLSEYNPLIEDYRTAKLVTQMFYYFVMGFTSRS